MRRHVIIGRFGTKDNVVVPVARDEHETLFPLVIGENSLNFGLSDVLSNLKKLKVFPSEVAVDLMILAAHVYAADTRISRTTESQDTWTREIRLVVPVSDPNLWSGAVKQIVRLLNFLTGDRWSVGFRSRPKPLAKIVEKATKGLLGSPFTGVSLFSGGLDSLIGTIDALESGETYLLVSHAGDGATSKAQDLCYAKLKENYKKVDFNRLRFWLNIPNEVFKEIKSEDTTRGRSFLFFSLGVLAGSGINQPFTLQVPENGLIALNVPLDTLRLGSLSTRTTHPFYMNSWNELLEQLGINGKLDNPYWNKTKGEMVANCANKKVLNETIKLSLSCSSPTKGRWHKITTQHCGYCLPCLIRRASIKKDPTTYTLQNLDTQTLDTLHSEGQQIRSFQLAIKRLAKNPDLANILIYKPGPLPHDPKIISELANVYKRGMAEVGKLLSKVKTKPQ
ncbi:MAG: hypothetical protein J0I84_22100 [Terrimonas sp.]|nr:hypothetical protein [Terrimonas sp.]OJY99601.1 MAG: hypothetical protein BGP13_22635 [Sphingobacteriales bacterium 40-81]